MYVEIRKWPFILHRPYYIVKAVVSASVGRCNTMTQKDFNCNSTYSCKAHCADLFFRFDVFGCFVVVMTHNHDDGKVVAHGSS